MKNVLITGITGQDGIFLTSEIIKKYTNTNIIGISRSKDNNLFYKRLKSLNTNIEKNLKIIQINLEDKNQVLNFIKDSNPEYIFNLSGPSSVYESYKDQSKTEESVKLIFNNLTDSLIETNNLANFLLPFSANSFPFNLFFWMYCTISSLCLFNIASLRSMMFCSIIFVIFSTLQ